MSKITNLNAALKMLCCTTCKAALNLNADTLACNGCGARFLIKDGIVSFMSTSSDDIKLSIEKWDLLYKKQLETKSYVKDYENYVNTFFNDVYRQVNDAKPLAESIYLEIGCGNFLFGQRVAPMCNLIVGIDFCPHALKIAKHMLDSKGVKNYLLIQGNILHMPLKNDVIDVIYGGGVIEHFENTQDCVDELYRVLKKGGASVNTVPYLNIGSLTYRQLWGNIPNVFGLKQLAEFVHIKLFKGKHMIFGYEMSFLPRTLRQLHKNAGFTDTCVSQFEVALSFDFLPKILKRPFVHLATKSKLFWPMIKVVAKK